MKQRQHLRAASHLAASLRPDALIRDPLMKWTAFDQQTAAALGAHMDAVEEPSQTAKDELDSGLDLAATSAPAAVLTQAGDREHALLITMRSKDAAHAGADEPTPEPTGYQAGGFLGLADEPLFDDDKKKR